MKNIPCRHRASSDARQDLPRDWNSIFKDQHRRQGQGNALEAEGPRPYRHHRGIVSEELHDLRGKDRPRHSGHRQKGGAEFQREGHRLPDPSQLPCAIVIAHHRLHPLTEADDRGQKEIEHLGHDRHGGHRRVPIDAGIEIQRHGGHAGHPLTEEGGHSAFENREIGLWRGGDTPDRDPDLALPPQEEGGEDRGADALAQQGGDGRSGDAQIQPEDENGVQKDIEHPADPQTDHRAVGLALPAQQIIQRKGQAHHRRAPQDVGGILKGIGVYGLGGPQDPDEPLQGQQPRQSQQASAHQRRDHRAGGDHRRPARKALSGRC